VTPTPDPVQYQPRLTAWSHTWRLLLALAISLLVWIEVVADQFGQRPVLFWADLVCGGVAFVLVVLRRRHPFLVVLVVTLLSGVSSLASGPAVLATISFATWRRLPRIFAVGVLWVATGTLYESVQPPPVEPVLFTVPLNVAVAAVAAATGMYIGSRRELVWTLRDRAQRAEAEQELRMRQARTSERARIAREMHDVLAHRISLVSMHAGALAYRDDLSADDARRSALVIRDSAHQALNELREVLGVLRDEVEPTEERPQPTFADLAGLLDEARAAGMRVSGELDVPTAERLPGQVGRTAYRIVQEALTNARKHAAGATVNVRVSGAPGDGLEVLVENGVPPGGRPAVPGAGLGLVGLTERAELAGGRLEHQRSGDRFRLRGWLPWPA
jgi:signal transduction histidine kinase